MPSPPKPWEVNGGASNGASTITSTAAIASPSITSPTAATAAVAGALPNATDVPPVPTRSNMPTTSAALSRPSPYGTSSYGSSYNRYGGLGGYGGYNSGMYGSSMYGSSMYSSPYNRFGSYGGSYGGYNRLGGYGGNMYGANGYGFGPGEEPGLTQRMESGTRATFEVIEQIVGAFGGFAQMLESTFMATHSSFMAMVGVAEQLGHLRSYLSQVFSIFALYRLVKRAIRKLTGQVEPGRPHELTLAEFTSYENQAAAPKMSRKPAMIFMLMVFGLPYLMHKLIQLISSKQQERLQTAAHTGDPAGVPQIDPSKLEFAQAVYDFRAESPMELNLKKGDIVAILSKSDPATNAMSPWWRGRLRDGTMGLFPGNYVEIIQKASPTSPTKDVPLPTGPEAMVDPIMSPMIKS